MSGCTCNYHLGMGPNLSCAVHGEETKRQFGIAKAPRPQDSLGSAEFALLDAVVDEAKKVYKESVAAADGDQGTETERWAAAFRADTCQTLITVLERVKTTGI